MNKHTNLPFENNYNLYSLLLNIRNQTIIERKKILEEKGIQNLVCVIKLNDLNILFNPLRLNIEEEN